MDGKSAGSSENELICKRTRRLLSRDLKIEITCVYSLGEMNTREAMNASEIFIYEAKL